MYYIRKLEGNSVRVWDCVTTKIMGVNKQFDDDGFGHGGAPSVNIMRIVCIIYTIHITFSVSIVNANISSHVGRS